MTSIYRFALVHRTHPPLERSAAAPRRFGSNDTSNDTRSDAYGMWIAGWRIP
jgi:hypothetical protein